MYGLYTEMQLYEPHVKPAPTLKFVGHSLFKSTDDSSLIAEEAARLGGLPVGTPVDCYEQVMCQTVQGSRASAFVEYFGQIGPTVYCVFRR